MDMEDNPIWSIYLVSYFRSFEAKNRHLFDVHIRQQVANSNYVMWYAYHITILLTKSTYKK